MKHLLLMGLFLISISVSSKTLEDFKKIIDAEETFFFYPDEKNGVHKYLEAKYDGCSFLFRDSVSTRKSNGHFYNWVHSRIFDLGKLRFIELAEGSGPEYYTILFGGTVRFPILVHDAQTSDEDGIKYHDDYHVFESLMRFKKLETAQEVLTIIADVQKECAGEQF